LDAQNGHHNTSRTTATRRASTRGGRLSLGLALAAATFVSGFGAPSPSVGESSAEAREGASAFDRPAALADKDRTLVAEYAPVSIDSLPDYQPEPPNQLPMGPPPLVIVTKGKLKRGESLGKALRRQGVSAGTIHVIAREMRDVFDFRRSRPDDRYRLGQDGDGNVIDFRYSTDPESSYYLAWNGQGYVVTHEAAELQPEVANVSGSVQSSLYDAIVELGEKPQLASDLADIFAWDIDFSRNVHPGDEFQILYERLYRTTDDGEHEYVRPGRILAAHYRGQVGDHSVIYFEEDGMGRYYRPDGSSLERAFLAAPLKFSRISSRFAKARPHPILKITRPHRGIDYAAKTGTPIWAVADGTVIYKGWAGASGNLVKVRHFNGYVSYYAHLSKFPANLKVGQVVTQKEVIGFVGDSGLATGPHVCFRVQRDGVYVDPFKIASPAGAPVDEDSWAAFRQKRDLLLADLAGGELTHSDEAL
jgi:murein DD-endopeptidase MepM/ murein hydrolase activator NlpD